MEVKKIKKLFCDHKEYWLKKGYSDQESDDLVLKYKGSRYHGSYKHYLVNGKTDDIETAKQLAKDWIDSKCTLKKENMLKNKFNGNAEEYAEFKTNAGKSLSGNKITDVSYWLKKGYSEEESLIKMNIAFRENSVRCIEYWIKRGYSQKESLMKIKNIQDNTSLDSFISKYGEEAGKLRYEKHLNIIEFKSKRSLKYWLNLGLTEEEAKLQLKSHQRSNSLMQRKCTEIWVREGYTLEEAKILANEYAKSKSIWNIQYWLNSGLSFEESKKKVFEIQRKNGKLGALKNRDNYTSGLEDIVHDQLIKIEQRFNIIQHPIIRNGNFTCFPDIYVDDKFYIEIYGDYWHANPLYHKDNSILIGGISAKEVRENDLNRKNNIEQITNKKVYIFWETDIRQIGVDVLYNNILLQENLK